MPDTAKRYGLQVDTLIDERNNFEKATESSIKYLLDIHDIF
jgi:hypothetical protein